MGEKITHFWPFGIDYCSYEGRNDSAIMFSPHLETYREMSFHFDMELLHIEEKGAGDNKTTVGVAKNSTIKKKKH